MKRSSTSGANPFDATNGRDGRQSLNIRRLLAIQVIPTHPCSTKEGLGSPRFPQSAVWLLWASIARKYPVFNKLPRQFRLRLKFRSTSPEMVRRPGGWGQLWRREAGRRTSDIDPLPANHDAQDC